MSPAAQILIAMIHDAIRSFRLHCLQRLVLRYWTVPEWVRRGVGRGLRAVSVGELQQRDRQVLSCI